MARLDVPDGEGLEAHRIWALAPHMGAGMAAMSEAVYVKSSLSIREREANVNRTFVNIERENFREDTDRHDRHVNVRS